MTGAMTIAERVAAFNTTFGDWPASHVWAAQEQGRDVIYGIWKVGQDFRNRSQLYGAYPHRYLERCWALFPDMVGGRVLHAFSGSLPRGPYVRMDLLRWRRPDVAADVTAPPFADGSFDLIFADPPYSPADAHEYGTPMVNRLAATKGLARILRPGGFLVWLDTNWPMHQKAVIPTTGQIIAVPDEWERSGEIGLVRSTNQRTRLITLFERTAV